MEINILEKFIPVYLLAIILCTSCMTTQFGYAVKNEHKEMIIKESDHVIDYAVLKNQDIPTFASRGVPGASRGITDAAISLATGAIKSMIAEDKKKYSAAYSFATTDLYFYDQLSTQSAFDPVGLQFKGFRLVRTYENKEGNTDTAFIASFVIDSSRSREIINNSIFRLKLQDLTLYKTKAKVTAGQKNSINMDVEIAFTTSYVNSNGQLFSDVETGKFYLLLRNAPLDKNSAGYAQYYNNLKGKTLDGKSFIIPRSFGYYLDKDGQASPCFSQGAYSIAVKVKESSKDKFVTKLLMENSSKIVEGVGTGATKLVKSLQKSVVSTSKVLKQ